MWPVDGADAQAMELGVPTGTVLGVALRHEELRADVRDGDVVLRVVRPFPHVHGAGRVEHGLSGEDGADAPRDGLDMVDLGDHGGVVVHLTAPLPHCWSRLRTEDHSLPGAHTAKAFLTPAGRVPRR